MLAIFPIQDLIGMDGNLRNPYAGAEQINVPADPDHIWKFRFHMPVEQMLEIHSFNDMLRAMLKIHGR
jgi:4-alpha-glucanotransferase